jgi:hypothetical protein
MSRRKGKGAPRSRAPKVQSRKRPAPTQPQKPGVYVPTDVTPEELFQAIGRLRKDARDEIDRLIQFLDKTDDYVSRELEEAVDDVPCDDSELEAGDGDDEPSLGSHVLPSGAVSYSMPVGRGGELDCEGDEHDGREPGEDDEPALGWHNTEPQYATAGGSMLAHEDEPSLGSTATMNQTAWAFGLGGDLEQGTTRRIDRPEPKPPTCNVCWPDGSRFDPANIKSNVVVIEQ